MIKQVVILGLVLILIGLLIFTKSNNNNTPQITEPFTALTQSQIKTYFINLDRDKDRWERVKHMGFERFEAINGKDLNKDNLISSDIVSKKNKLRPGQLGCALSHIEVLKKIHKQPEPYGLILEDDVIIPDNFVDTSIDIPETFDIIFLGGCNIKGTKVAPNLIKPCKEKRAYNLCLHAVLVNKNSVPKILKLLTPLYRPTIVN